MSEGPPQRNEQESRKERRIALAIELSQSGEIFPFPGITPEAYAKIKADLADFPEYSTPLDELLERFNKEGMKVMLGKNPTAVQVYILPAQSTDIEMDGFLPRTLQITEEMNEMVKELLLLSRP